ncbi:tripartite tricarboxylate transporter substrate binding protein [Variovorax sp. 770b2]|uniref:Bug family tripartite tricarboxylate transporter substrate binding protein n=1 Tax=Variovorax sp. 770b2 TaxID=1566271 RepID=UPI0008E5851B|nr:tripartite tricarboxylate transporter substrate binding protein [Variovorax sp. 770b2]SFQ01866.1 Tripartite-type tricarboxylate transporter, receptor component TctC [Variovorax sp. 770b2]
MFEINRRRFTLLTAAAGAAPQLAFAQNEWPSKSIRVVVPFGAGMSVDALARLLGDGLGKSLGQAVIVDNKPGAAGLIGTADAARSAPDGYTLLAGVTSVMSMSPHVYAKMPYQALQDFTPIVRTANFSFVLLAGLAQPYKTLPELLSLARAKPTSVDYASVGVGTAPHVLMEMLASLADVKLTHIPYKSPFLSDLMGGQVAIGFEPTTTAIPLIKSGKVRALAIGSKARNPQLPDVPALAEFFPGFEGDNWHGLFAPRGTPDAIVQRVNTEMNRVLQTSEIRTRLADLGLQPGGGTSNEFRDYFRADYARWGEVIRQFNIRID